MNNSGPIQSNTILQQSPPHQQTIPQMAGPSSQPQSNQLINQASVSHSSQQQQQQSTQEQNYFNAPTEPQIAETQLATTMR